MTFCLMARYTGGGYDNAYIDASGWVTTISTNNSLVDFEIYKYGGVNYLKVNQPNNKWNGYYLSVNKNGYLGVYAWSGASGWKMSGKNLVSVFNGQIVGSGDNNFFRAAAGLRSFEFDNAELIAGLS